MQGMYNIKLSDAQQATVRTQRRNSVWPTQLFVSEGNYCLKYMLEIRSFVVDKLPENGTLVPKHVGVGT